MKFKPVRSPFVVLFWLLWGTVLANPLDAGWQLFQNNDLIGARKQFSAAALQDDLAAEAALGEALCDWMEQKNKEAFAHFLTFFKRSPNPYPYLYALWSSPCVMENYGKKSEEKLRFLDELIQDKRLHGTLKAMAHQMLGNHYQAVGDFKRANECFARIGALERFQATGVFENVSGSGFNKDYETLAKPQADAVFSNKGGAPIHWFDVKKIRNDKWFDFTYNFYVDNSVLFAQTFVSSPADTSVVLRCGVSGSVKVWVNDVLVISESEERNIDMDIYNQWVKLRKGNNRILVQIGESEISQANFMIRLTDANGQPVQGLTHQSAWQPYEKGAFSPRPEPLFAEVFFKEELAKKPNDFLLRLLLAEHYLRNENFFENRHALEEARKLAPRCAFLTTRFIEAATRDQNVTQKAREEEFLKTSDPNCYPSMVAFYNEAIQKEDYEEADRLLLRIEERFGKTEVTDVLRLNIVSKRKKAEEVVTLANALYARYPELWEAVELKCAVEEATQRDASQSIKVLQKYLQTNYSDKAVSTLASKYFAQGNFEKGMKWMLLRVENQPHAIGYYAKIAEIYFGAQDYAKAAEWLEKAVDMCPFYGTLWNKLGKVYEAQKRNAEAIKAFSTCIAYEPTNYEAHRLLRTMQNKPDLSSYFGSVNAEEQFKQSPGQEEFPEAGSIILLNDKQRIIYPEGANEERSEVLIKVLNKSGVEAWKEYTIGFNAYTQRLILERAELLKKDGSKLPAETNENQLVFSTLEPGDALHLIYRIEDYYSGKLSKQFWDRFSFNYRIPCLKARYSLLLPTATKFRYNILNTQLTPKVDTLNTDPYTLYVFEKNNVKEIKDEPFMPPVNDVGAILEVSSIANWDFISNFYGDLAANKAKSDYEIKETIRTLFPNGRPASDLETAKAIHAFIAHQISYSNVSFLHTALVPQKASRTLNTKLGDCKDVSTLFVALCREVGIEANLVLIDTRENGDRHMTLPSMEFNHCIARCRADGKEHWVELTDNNLSFGSISGDLAKSRSLLIPSAGQTLSGTDLIPLLAPHRAPNAISRNSRFTFEGNDVKATRSTQRTGALASATRWDYKDLGQEEMEKKMAQAISSDYTTPVRLSSLSFKNLYALSDTVAYTLAFSATKQLSELAGMKVYKMVWADAYGSLDFVSSDAREFPFNVWELNNSDWLEETMTVDFPPGKKLLEVPKNERLSCTAMEYELSYRTGPTSITAVRRIKVKADQVQPQDYPAFKAFMIKVAEADDRQIAFK